MVPPPGVADTPTEPPWASTMAATIASLASDGQDGSVDAAGAVVDASTAAALREAAVVPEDALERNDSGTALHEVGALVVPGPTGTNVNDVYIGIRG